MKMRLILLSVVAGVLPWAALGGAAVQRNNLASANDAFGVELFKHLAERPGNLAISPLSVHVALSMTSAGARGETANQMVKILRLPRNGTAHAGVGALINEMVQGERAGKSGNELSIANSLWMQKAYSFEKSFVEIMRRDYSAEGKSVDYTAGEAVPREQINQWVSDQTRRKILEIVPPGILTHDTRLVLVNAIYLKGTWAVKFDKSRTTDSPFRLDSGQSVSVSMMSATESFPYAEEPKFQVLELPYSGRNLSMLLLLPKGGHRLSAIEAGLTAERIDQLCRRTREQKVSVFMPRFRIESGFRLNETLQKMGMVDAFLDRAADFSGITMQERLFISAVLHKTLVDVDEEGTEAAAATAVVLERSTAAPKLAVFRADRPFLFLIRHNPTGTILFLGRVANPSL